MKIHDEDIECRNSIVCQFVSDFFAEVDNIFYVCM